MLWIIIISVIAIAFSVLLATKIYKMDSGTDKMKEISEAIHEGAMAFLNKEYRILAVYLVIVASVLYYLGYIGKLSDGIIMSYAFIAGSICSALAGNIGMRVATKANAKTAFAAKKSLHKGLEVAFYSGSVIGLSVVGIGLLGVSVLYSIFKNPSMIYGFGFGASSIALFARVGGGIFTKGADVGADLVGKIEAGIPEDDPRNPAVIADNVGDNVGDVAGMGADLFESYVDSIIAAMVIGAGLVTFGGNAVILPMALAGVGIISSLIGLYFVRISKKAKPAAEINIGIFSASIAMAILSYFVIQKMMGDIGLYYATISGLGAGILIGLMTEYYTSPNRRPTQSVAEAAKSGAGTNIIEGLSVGMLSTVMPVLGVCGAIWLAYHFAGMYGIAIAAVGMLSTIGITLASDSYGSIADNAEGIAEMAGMGKLTRKRTESLDAVGNTTAAMGKGFAIGSAALTSLALFASFAAVTSKITGSPMVIDVTVPNVMIGVFLGALLPFVFSSFTMRAVGKCAEAMVSEVRRQFKKSKGIMKGTVKPDYKKCVEISTHSALKQMVLPSLIAIVMPIIIGMWDLNALGGLLAGTITTGFLMAVFMANAGASFDNAKKYVESGKLGGKGSIVHKATVVGDTVGDPLKDTSGPSLNILIKLISIVALVFVPLFI
ncbi:MAG: sodium-translocating pyrophosphatase [Nanoarchaeota archaeon]